MSLEIKRLHLASLQGIDGGRWPVHGFVVTHPGGAVLVDTGVGGPQQVLDDWRVVNRSVADALADAEVLPGLEVIATPGHTEGHQCVIVRGGGDGFDLLIGDAAYTPRQYAEPDRGKLPAGQASDIPVWRDSMRRIRSLCPERVHFCHHTDIIHS